MPNGLTRTTLCMLIGLALTATAAARGQEAEPLLAAESIAFDGGVVLLDKTLLEHRAWVAQTVEAEIKQAKQARAIDHLAVHRGARRITDAGFDILGYDKQGGLYEAALQRCVKTLTDSQRPAFLLPDRVTVFVLTKENAKAYLRAGGTLPFVTYDRVNDKASLKVATQFSDHDTLLPNILLMQGAGVNNEDVAFTQDWLEQTLRAFYLFPKEQIPAWLQADGSSPPADDTVGEDGLFSASTLSAAIAFAHPLLESKLRLQEDEHTTWFTAGLAFKLAGLIIEHIDDKPAFELYQAMLTGGSDPLELPDPEHDPFTAKSNLRYMPLAAIPYETSKPDRALRRYRLAASVKEVSLLINHLTPQRLPELLQVLEEEAIDSAQALEAAVHDRFGYDITARLDLYQPHDTAQASYDALIKEALTHRDNKDLSAMALALNRAYEVQLGKAIPDVPGIYIALHRTARQVRNEGPARVAIIIAWWDALDRQPQGISDAQRRELAFAWTSEAMDAADLTLAYGLVDRLDDKPLQLDGMVDDARIIEQIIKLVRASRRIDEGRLDAARALIDQALGGLPDDLIEGFYEQRIQPLVEHLEMRLNTRRPSLPALGRSRQEAGAAPVASRAS